MRVLKEARFPRTAIAADDVLELRDERSRPSVVLARFRADQACEWDTARLVTVDAGDGFAPDSVALIVGLAEKEKKRL